MQLTPGMIYDRDMCGSRECIHIPMMLVWSKQYLKGSDNVSLIDPSTGEVGPVLGHKFDCKIDPFIDVVGPNIGVLMYLKPSTVKNIHHDFTIIGVDK